ncbi:MaoC/PaaZ C-terminal domain-containing protein [Streptomyces sp. NPDC000594]|uniref:MaoC/PaaZ C-terminal domain-containing protein n=1 Tax=Streptomyces sp. NPDC000594 TaxID=3154261 RepID=UPI00332C2EB6
MTAPATPEISPEVSSGASPEASPGIRPGTELPPLRQAPLTEAAIAAYARASGDTNPIHLDPEAARAVDLPGVIAHGMLTMALLGRTVTAWADRDRLRSLRTTFVAPLPAGSAVICTGTVTDVTTTEDGGETRAVVRLVARRPDGRTVARGRAVVALEPEALGRPNDAPV